MRGSWFLLWQCFFSWYAGVVYYDQAEHPHPSAHSPILFQDLTPYTCPVTTQALPHALDPLKPYFCLLVKHLVCQAPNLECVL